MASRRLIVSATTNDALADQDIRTVLEPSVVNLWGSCVTVTDQIGLRLDKTIIMDDGILNIQAAALGSCRINVDGLVFNTVVGAGTLRLPVPILTASVIVHLSVEPLL